MGVNLYFEFLLCWSFTGEHGLFKMLSQPDDFNDDLGIPLDTPSQLDSNDKSDCDEKSEHSDLGDQFDEG